MKKRFVLLLAAMLLLAMLCGACRADSDVPTGEGTSPGESTAAPTQDATESPEQTTPAQSEAIESIPMETEPPVTEPPAQTAPAESEPEDTEPVDTEPAETEPEADTSPETEPEEPTEDANMGEWA